MRVAFYTLGCKVNQYESEALSAAFAQIGFETVPADQPADVYIINSCTVTSASDQKTRQLLHRLRRQNPDAVIALTGCFPQAFPERALQMEEADIIRGARDRLKLLDDVQAVLSSGGRIHALFPHERGEAFESMAIGRFHERTRAFVKIEDGCDKYCSYCIIPKARGPIRSKPLKELESELHTLSANGYREIVLVGINLSSYGRELGCGLTDAVELACSVPGIERVRLGSLEPELLSDGDLMRLAKLPKFCPQFHLSLQSGCDETLRRMNRRYTSAEYLTLVQKIRRTFENPAITTDIMVGFPGETEEEFGKSLAFVKAVGFARAHVFAYSRRTGTRADRMPCQLTRREKECRSAAMIAATNEARAAFLRTQTGLVEPVLFETCTADGCYEGYTPNYSLVRVKYDKPLSGKIFPVLITGAEAEYCTGQLVQEP